jgi:hypothetical protein
MSEEIKYISELSDFIKEISEDNDGKTNLYRGQSNSEWGIEASIFRGKYTKDKEADIYNKIRKYNFEELKKRDCYLDDLIDMQHYGAPTRLIDWSYNPLMSLYFAVAYDSSIEGKLFMYKLDKSDLISFDKEEYKHLSKLLFVDVTKEVLAFDAYEEEIMKIIKNLFTKNKNIYFLDTTVCNSRIKAQQGCFSLFLDKKEKYFNYVLDAILDDLSRTFLSLKRNEKFNTIYDNYSSIIKKDINLTGDIDKLTEDSFNRIHEKLDLNKKYDSSLDRIESIGGGPMRMKPKMQDLDKEILTKYYTYIISNLNYLIKDYSEISQEKMIVYTIKSENKAKIKRQLENIGITPMVVYPDLKGTIEHINNKYKEEKKD